MTPSLLLYGLAAIVLIVALAYDNRRHPHVWEDRDGD